MKKDYILAEIKRTALSNGGSPLGLAAFSKQTGIKDSDCVGKYWVRWSEAVEEAGFKPNAFRTAIKDEVLLEKLISLVRELGHFPVQNELLLKARVDPGFPQFRPFRRLAGGLGTRLANRLREFCIQQGGYDDVLSLLPDVSHSQNQEQRHNPGKEQDFGFVYLMKMGRHYKIGRSNSVGRREYELAIQMPERLKTIHRITTDDPVGIEGYWHKRFEPKKTKTNAEWFDLDSADIKAFTRRRFM